MNYLNTILAFLMCVYRRNSVVVGTKTDVFYQINENFMMMLELKKKKRNEKWMYGVNNIVSGSNSWFREKDLNSWKPMILGFTLLS